MKRAYIAGAMSNKNCIDFLHNLKRGINESVKKLLEGYAVFSPFIDFQYFLNLKEGEDISLALIQKNSMAWLEVSDIVFVLPGYEHSEGTLREIARAKELNITVKYL